MLNLTLFDIFNQPRLNNLNHTLQRLITNQEDNVIKSFLDADINAFIKSRNKFNAWKNICLRIINSVTTCYFDKRPDYDLIYFLPFYCKIKGFDSYSVGANLYSDKKRIFTLFFKDTTQNNQWTLYNDLLNENPIIIGTWSKDIKPGLKTINTTGLELILDDNKTTQQKKSNNNILNPKYSGNTITILDLLNFVDKLKSIYGKKQDNSI